MSFIQTTGFHIFRRSFLFTIGFWFPNKTALPFVFYFEKFITIRQCCRFHEYLRLLMSVSRNES